MYRYDVVLFTSKTIGNMKSIKVFSLLTTFCLLNSINAFAQASSDKCDGANHEGTIYKIVEDMPCPVTCEEGLDYTDSAACTKEKIDNYVMGHESYAALSESVVGTGSIHMRFIVEADGCLTDFIIRREVCDGCGDQLKNILSSMPQWKAGKTLDSPVRVLQNYTLRFSSVAGSQE